jgi:DNA polymerase III epsilon subunit family exonuclease
MNLIHNPEFIKLEKEFNFLRHARETLSGLKVLSAVVVDTETTGLEPEKSEIIEIAGLKIVKGEIVDVFNVLININKPLPTEIVQLTGITEEMLAEGEEKRTALRKFVAFIGDLPLIAHNVDFDLPFLNTHLNRELGFTLANLAICTLKLSRRLIPGLPSYRLAKVAEQYKIPTPITHRALGDVEITHQIWLRLIEVLEENGITNVEALKTFVATL